MKKPNFTIVILVFLCEALACGGTRTFITAKGIFKNASIEMDMGFDGSASFCIVIDRPHAQRIPVEWNELSSLDRDIFLLRPISWYENGKRHYYDMCQIKGIGVFYMMAICYDMKDVKLRGKLKIIFIELKNLDKSILWEIGRLDYYRNY